MFVFILSFLFAIRNTYLVNKGRNINTKVGAHTQNKDEEGVAKMVIIYEMPAKNHPSC